MKKILMLPSWYPTKRNPVGGSFFREQAAALSSRYEFLVVKVDFRILGPKEFLARLLRGNGFAPTLPIAIWLSRRELFYSSGMAFAWVKSGISCHTPSSRVSSKSTTIRGKGEPTSRCWTIPRGAWISRPTLYLR